MEKETKKEATEIKVKNKNKNGSFSHTIMHYFGKHKFFAITIFLCIIFSVICSVAIPLLTLQMTTDITLKNMKAMYSDDSVIQAYKDSLVIKYWGLSWQTVLYIGAGVILFNILTMFVSQKTQVLLGKKIEISLRIKSLQALVKQDISYYSNKKIGEIVTKLISDTQIVGDQASTVPVQMIQAVIQVTGAIIMMFIFDVKMTAIALGVFISIIIIMISCFSLVKKKIETVRTVITDVNGNVTDKINTIRLVKSSGTELYESEKFIEEHKTYYKAVKKMSGTQALMVTVLFGGITLLQFMTIGSAMILHGGTSSTESQTFFSTTFTAYNLAQGVMISPLFQIVMASVGIAQASVAGMRINQVVTSQPIIDLHYTDGEIVDDLNGSIQFKDIEFAYPEKPDQVILPKFDFTFEEGKSYAFVGETGSGKSTIAKLLLRFYDPSNGDVLLNDGKQNLKDINLASYLNFVGYVEQEPQIMFGDVFMNVKYGKFDATDEEVIEACKKAELHELIETWPDKYGTILGERGFMLSGGQKQRLVIARMFLKNPKLLILDEATSALDNVVEKEIQAKLEDLMKGRTTIAIAHRLSTIKNSDAIIVLAPGQGIVQVGKFDELKKAKGHFKKLYDAGSTL